MSKINSWALLMASIMITILAGGCGLKTPDMVMFGGQDATFQLVLSVVGHFKAELGCAVVQVVKYARDNEKEHPGFKNPYSWIETSKATAKMSLILTADDMSAVSPNVSVGEPFAPAINAFAGKVMVSTPQSYAVGFGGNLGSEANRKETSDYSIGIKEAFLDKAIYYTPGSDHQNHCKDYDGFLTDSDLKLYDWLSSRLYPLLVNNPSMPNDLNDTPPKTLQSDITFTVTASGNVTPTWKLVPTSINTSGVFFSGTRKNIDEMIITISASPDEASTQQNIAKQGAFNQQK